MQPPEQDALTAVAPPPRPAPPAADVEIVGYDQYIDDRIRRTRQMVKVVDVAHAVMLLVVAWIVLLAGAAVVEHWFVPGGLTPSGRYLLFGASVAASVGLLATRLLPILTRRVNPLYAADAIERTTPSLKNTLVNLLLLRGDAGQGRAPAALREELEREAAERIVGAEGDAVIERDGVIRLGYVIVGLLVLFVLYAAISPKNPFATAARVLAPWSNIEAPTRVRIHDLQPGDAEIAQGDFAAVSARITGMEEDEQAWLVTSTADRQQREQRVTLPSTGDNRFAIKLPAGDTLGLQQDLAYRIEAGDARSRPFRLRVVAAPTIVVRSVHYDYPEYTGYLDRTTANAGDLRAIEGTRVTIEAVTNLPIETAQVDLGADGLSDLRMQITEQSASASFTLELRDDRQTPRHPTYVLRFTTPDGRANNDPVTHRIEVLPDLPPEVEITEPAQPLTEIRQDEPLAFNLRARDPDFGLSSVKLEGTRIATQPGGRGRKVVERLLLKQPLEGRFDGLYRFTPEDHGLKAGDVVEFRAIAKDVRAPRAQQAVSSVRRVRIIGPPDKNVDDPANQRDRADDSQNQKDESTNEPPQGDSQELDESGEQGNQGSAGESGESSPQSDQSQGDEGQENGQQGGQNNSDEQDSSDGKSNSGAGGIKGEETQGGSNTEASEDGAGGGSQSSSGDQQGDPSQQGGSQSGGSSEQRQPSEGQRNGSEQGDRGAQSEPSDNSQPGNDPAASETPVASDGENDAEAFDRIQEYLDQQDRNQSSGDPQQGKGNESLQASDDQVDQGSEQNDPSSNAEGRSPDDGASNRTPQDSGQDGSGESPTEPNESRKQSDAVGAEEPQSEGGGEQGDGQESPRDGTGSAGESNSADDGQGQAADRGAGDETSAGGDRSASDHPTGKPGEGEQGDGSTQAESDQGKPGEGDSQQGGQDAGRQESSSDASDQSPTDETGDGAEPSESGAAQSGGDQGKPGDQSQQEGSEESPGDSGASGEEVSEGGRQSKSDPSDSEGSQGNQSGSEAPAGDQQDEQQPVGEQSSAQQQDGDRSKQPSESANEGASPRGGQGARPGEGDPPEAAAGDAANLEYARKQTDLILDELSDRLREKNVDRELLDKLGWTEDDLRRFIKRWRTRKERARSNPQSRTALDDDLRSLGLKPRDLKGESVRTADDVRVGAGYRSEAPAAVRERLRAYSQGVSRVREPAGSNK